MNEWKEMRRKSILLKTTRDNRDRENLSQQRKSKYAFLICLERFNR